MKQIFPNNLIRAGKSERSNTLFWSALLIILIFGAVIRFYGISWDEGFSYTPHPDERAILMKVREISFPPFHDLGSLFDPEKSSWNPKWFPYGSFPIYVLKLVGEIFSKISGQEIHDLRDLGRFISVIADLGTILGIAMLGRSAFSNRVSILAAGLISISVIHIQLAHFFAFDTFLAFFCVWSLFFLLKVLRTGKTSASVIAGILIGLGLASKISIMPILGAYVFAHLIHAFTISSARSIVKESIIARMLTSAVWGLIALVITFVLVEPYAILDWDRFTHDIKEQANMVRRISDYPYTRQYIETTPYLYQLIQLGRWGLGWPLVVLSLVGVGWACCKGISPRASLLFIFLSMIIPATILIFNNSIFYLVIAMAITFGCLLVTSFFRNESGRVSMLLLSWIIPYVLITGSFDVKFIRYSLPFIPLTTLFASAFLVHWATSKSIRKRFTGVITLGITILITALCAASLASIYSEKHTGVQASVWLNDNAPSGSHILKEHWEEGLPNLSAFSIEELAIYEPDDKFKIKRMSEKLASSDYLVIYSNRLYGTVTRLPDRYPLMIGYYHALFTGQLGYEPVFIGTSYLNLMGFSFKEDTFTRSNLPDPGILHNKDRSWGVNAGFADESFSVYDHPKVMIFENISRLSDTQINESIHSESDSLVPSEHHSRPQQNLEVENPDDEKNLMMDPWLSQEQKKGGTWSEIFTTHPVITKMPALIWILYIEFVALLAFPIGFIVFRGLRNRGFLLMKALGILIVSFVAWMLASLHIVPFGNLAVWAGIGTLAAISSFATYLYKEEILLFIKTRWKTITLLETIFLVAFFAFLLVRMANPDLWHPYRGGEKPMDIGYLNAVVKSSYMPPYDPWFSGGYLNYYYWGQFIIGCFIHLTGITTEIAYNLAIPTLFALTVGGAFTIGSNLVRVPTAKLGPSNLSTYFKRKLNWFVGGLAIVFVCIIGNFDGLFQTITLAKNQFIHGMAGGEFDFWRSSRMMAPDPPGFEITEFPFFTFLFADLHAHLISIPFTLLVLGLGMAIFLAPRKNVPKRFRLQEEFIRLSILGLAVGALRVINTWDLPTYMLISFLCIGIGQFVRHGGLGISPIGTSLWKSGYTCLIAFLAFLPYHITSISFFTNFHTTTNMTTFGQLLSINGLFLFLIASGCAYLLKTQLKNFVSKLKLFFISIINHKDLSSTKVIGLTIFLLFFGYLATFTLIGKLGGVIPLSTGLILILVISLFSSPPSEYNSLPIRIFAHLLGIAGLGLLIFVEIWRLEGDIDRMNTVFKFYGQAWILLGLSSTYFLYKAFVKTSELTPLLRWTWTGITVGLIITSLIYPVMGSRDRIRDRFEHGDGKFTLNGYSYIEESVYKDPKGEIDLSSDMVGINWLRHNISGSPVVLEAVTPTYRWGSRVSINTGLPTVIGWKWHQEQQRWGQREMVAKRIRDVEAIYTDPKLANALLDKYKVDYVYIGQVEKLYYPAEGIAHLKTGLDGKLLPVFTSENVTIMKVVR